MQSCYSPLSLVQYLFTSDSLSDQCYAILNMPSEITDVTLALYLQLFLLTCLLEAPIYWFALSGNSFFQRCKIIVLLNLATHPIVCFVIPYLTSTAGLTYGQNNAIGELFAPVVEALLLHFVWRKSWVVSLVVAFAANLFSWGVGAIIVQALF